MADDLCYKWNEDIIKSFPSGAKFGFSCKSGKICWIVEAAVDVMKYEYNRPSRFEKLYKNSRSNFNPLNDYKTLK